MGLFLVVSLGVGGCEAFGGTVVVEVMAVSDGCVKMVSDTTVLVASPRLPSLYRRVLFASWKPFAAATVVLAAVMSALLLTGAAQHAAVYAAFAVALCVIGAFTGVKQAWADDPSLGSTAGGRVVAVTPNVFYEKLERTATAQLLRMLATRDELREPGLAGPLVSAGVLETVDELCFETARLWRAQYDLYDIYAWRSQLGEPFASPADAELRTEAGQIGERIDGHVAVVTGLRDAVVAARAEHAELSGATSDAVSASLVGRLSEATLAARAARLAAVEVRAADSTT